MTVDAAMKRATGDWLLRPVTTLRPLDEERARR